jgi:hypothetical protein
MSRVVSGSVRDVNMTRTEPDTASDSFLACCQRAQNPTPCDRSSFDIIRPSPSSIPSGFAAGGAEAMLFEVAPDDMTPESELKKLKINAGPLACCLSDRTFDVCILF